MIDYMKPVGAFLENTIRPLIKETKWLLDEFEKKGIKVTEENIQKVTKNLFDCYIKYALVEFAQNIFITIIVSFTIWMILQ
jgi:hypothetical protein